MRPAPSLSERVHEQPAYSREFDHRFNTRREAKICTTKLSRRNIPTCGSALKPDQLNQWGSGACAGEIGLDIALEYLALYSQRGAAASSHPGEALSPQPIGGPVQALTPLHMGNRDLNEALHELPHRSPPTNSHPDPLPSLMRFPPIAVVKEIDPVQIIDSAPPLAGIEARCPSVRYPIGMSLGITQRVGIASRHKAVGGECAGTIAPGRRFRRQWFGVRQRRSSLSRSHHRRGRQVRRRTHLSVGRRTLMRPDFPRTTPSQSLLPLPPYQSAPLKVYYSERCMMMRS